MIFPGLLAPRRSRRALATRLAAVEMRTEALSRYAQRLADRLSGATHRAAFLARRRDYWLDRFVEADRARQSTERRLAELLVDIEEATTRLGALQASLEWTRRELEDMTRSRDEFMDMADRLRQAGEAAKKGRKG